MQKVLSSNRWSCIPCAFASVLDVSLRDILDFVGHDGSEIIWPNLPEPKRRRGFHIQEMIDFAWMQSCAVTHFEILSSLRPDSASAMFSITSPLALEEKLHRILIERSVVGGTLTNGMRHAVAWDGTKVFDSRAPGITRLNQMNISEFWVVTETTRRVPLRSKEKSLELLSGL
jgi:hypothetical protein